MQFPVPPKFDRGSITLPDGTILPVGSSDPTFDNWLEQMRNTGDIISAHEIQADTIQASHVDVGLFLTFPSDEKLTLYLKLDEVSGIVATDSSGNTNNGTMTNGEGDEWTPNGISGGAYAPNAADEEINVSNNATLNPGTGDFSYTFWIIGPNFGDAGHFVIRKYDGASGFYASILANGTVRARLVEGANARNTGSTTDIDDGNKHFIVVTIDHTTNELQSLYIDGELENSGNIIAIGDIDVGNDFLIANNCNGLVIDEVRFYKSQVLTPAEVQALYLFPSGNEAGVISGKSIAVNTITATEINGAGFGTLTITSGKLEIDVAEGILVKNGADLTLAVGGDLKFGLSDTNPSLINYGDYLYFGMAVTSSRGWSCWPETISTGYVSFGYDPINNVNKPIALFSAYADHTVNIVVDPIEGTGLAIYEAVVVGGNGSLAIRTEDSAVRVNATGVQITNHLQPLNDSTTELGLTAKRWSKGWFDELVGGKIKLTPIGGVAVLLTNKTGENSVAGQLVRADTATNDAVILTGVSDDECFGVFLEAGIADGSEAWVVVSGIADVAFNDNIAAVRGNWVGTGAAGYARTQAAPPALGIAAHFEEIGHSIENVTAGGGGTHILGRCVIHLN